ncbi:MAG: helix-turn-helix domain-containing protein [Thermoprotei archaeon]|jgi:DNA-binding transcriptional ArsR family regulator
MSDDLSLIESKLKGKTLLVYWYLISSNSRIVKVREVQRALKFSSPSIAAYHLSKLEELGLVRKTEHGEYELVQEVKIGILRFFTRIGKFLIPRFLFYSIWFSTMIIMYLMLYPQTGDVHNIMAIIFGISSLIIFWFETIKLLRNKPI